MKKSLFILAIVLLLTLTLTITAFATKPLPVKGYVDFTTYIPGDPTIYCVYSGEGYGPPDGFMYGCISQPYSPGLAEHGIIMDFTVAGLTGTCQLNIRTYDLDGIARGVINRCTGELEGFHMKMTAWTNGLWEGTYHFAP